MAVTNDAIKTRALALMGGGADEARLSPLCAAANSRLTAMLRDGMEAAAIEERFLTAAAMLAVSLYMELDAADGESSVRAGNVTVSRRDPGGRRSSASALRSEAEALLSGFISDPAFDFRGVSG